MKYYTSYEKNTHQTPKEKKQEYWKTAIGLQQVDQLKPSNYLLELSQKNIEENLSNQEIEKLLYSHYTNESKEEEIERKPLVGPLVRLDLSGKDLEQSGLR